MTDQEDAHADDQGEDAEEVTDGVLPEDTGSEPEPEPEGSPG